ncbi:hypothetical protein H0H92_001620, partial [Tricholoma furcatifolium]
MNILVVPRLVFPPPPRKRKAKGKQKADVEKKKPPRPPQRLIDMKSMIALGEPQITNANRWVHAPDSVPSHWSSSLPNIPKILRND